MFSSATLIKSYFSKWILIRQGDWHFYLASTSRSMHVNIVLKLSPEKKHETAKIPSWALLFVVNFPSGTTVPEVSFFEKIKLRIFT